MSIHNVTPDTLDHICSIPDCGQQRAGLAHSEARVVQGQIQIVCPACGSVECFNPDLPEWEETSPTRDEASREQVRNVRALYKHVLA